jgi:hypothetical protein
MLQLISLKDPLCTAKKPITESETASLKLKINKGLFFPRKEKDTCNQGNVYRPSPPKRFGDKDIL